MSFEVEHQRKEAERAQAMDAMKTKFFTNVSHEFRTPLTLVISPLERIIKQLRDEDLKGQLNLVQRNAKRLLSLVNQLLDFRKMEVQEVKLHPAIGDIVPFIRDISHSFSDIAEKKKIRFSFASNIDSLEIYFDKDKIEKILFNLLSNAFKYTHDNGEVSVNLVYNVPVVVTAREEQKTVLGKILCFRVEPQIFGPKSLIEQKGKMVIWITDDARRIPVRAQIDTGYGKIEVKLKSAIKTT